MKLPVYHVDAFTRRLFHGNPAAVVVLEERWLPDDVMQSIGTEQNLAMSAFVLRKRGARAFGVRWFNAQREFPICGHATIAAAHVLWSHEGAKGRSMVFRSARESLTVERSRDELGERLTLDLPADPPRKGRMTAALCAALGRAPAEVWQSRDIIAVFENKRDVHELQPDMAKVAALDTFGVVVTAPGAGHDFVSRFFAPRHGLNEDAVSGSTHCALAPLWAERLGKTHLTAHQVSHRSGELFCELRGKRVRIGGHAVTYSRGTMRV